MRGYMLAQGHGVVLNGVCFENGRMTFLPYKSQADHRAMTHRRRARIIAHLGGKCVVCGTTAHLHCHHKDPAQKAFTIGKMTNTLWSKLIGELTKCELRCFKHHWELHEARHGTVSKYNTGCHCAPCRRANADYHNAAYHRRRGHG